MNMWKKLTEQEMEKIRPFVAEGISLIPKYKGLNKYGNPHIYAGLAEDEKGNLHEIEILDNGWEKSESNREIEYEDLVDQC